MNLDLEYKIYYEIYVQNHLTYDIDLLIVVHYFNYIVKRFVNTIINFIIKFNKLIEIVLFFCVVECSTYKSTHEDVAFATTNDIFDSI